MNFVSMHHWIKIFVVYVFMFCPPCILLAGNKKGDDNKQKRNFVIATWNLGHFSEGSKPYSTIKGSIISSKIKEFNRVINDSIQADVICLNEYSQMFGEDEKGKQFFTRDLALEHYSIKKEGPLMGYSCNSIFGKQRIKNVKVHMFKCVEPFLAEVPRSRNYYFLTADLYLKGQKILLVCAHTISSNEALCYAMNVEIINFCHKYDRVVMCGDWNSLDYSVFKQAGYSLGNSGSIKTYPGKSYPLDNIIVKGVKIIETKSFKSNLSDHYPLVSIITLE